MASPALSPSAASRTSRLQREVLVVTERLLREFAHRCSPDAVLACIADCDTMLRAAGVRNGLPIALESMVAARLREGQAAFVSLVVPTEPGDLQELAAAN
jgi:hypothetical protein